jgi:phosphomannomutase
MKIYLFDIDGTLTPARQPMTSEFKQMFSKWCENKIVYLVTGSDYDKVKEQVDIDILNKITGVFGSMGNELYISGELKYSNNDTIPHACIEFLNQKLKSTSYPYERGIINFEHRIGMLNFSVVGRGISLETRKKYFEWDSVAKERQHIADEFNKLFPEYEAKLGGQISLDIQRVGKNKAQVVDYLQKQYNNFYFVFTGDRTMPGGNDYDLAHKIITNSIGVVNQVENQNDVLKLLYI